VTLEETIPWLKKNSQTTIEEIRTAVIWYKACSVIAPDYYADYLPDNPWIHQPFENYEFTSPAELAEKVSQPC
ncbi:MAG: phosphoribosyltransferase, partial [Cyanobacteria bacterium J06629_18]